MDAYGEKHSNGSSDSAYLRVSLTLPFLEYSVRWEKPQCPSLPCCDSPLCTKKRFLYSNCQDLSFVLLTICADDWFPLCQCGRSTTASMNLIGERLVLGFTNSVADSSLERCRPLRSPHPTGIRHQICANNFLVSRGTWTNFLEGRV